MTNSKSHPIRQLLDFAAMGDRPSVSDVNSVVARFELSDAQASELRDAIARVLEIHGTGERGLARAEASAAGALLLDADQPDRLSSVPADAGPRELAAAVHDRTQSDDVAAALRNIQR